MWTSKRAGSGAKKDKLAQWISKSLLTTLTPQNIRSGFKTTGIWPYDSSKMQGKMGAACAYSNVEAEAADEVVVQEIVDHNSTDVDETSACTQYYIISDPDSDSDDGNNSSIGSQGDTVSSQNAGGVRQGLKPNLRQILALLSIQPSTSYNRRHLEPIVDYSKFITLTDDGHIGKLDHVAATKKNLRRARKQKN